MNYHSALLLLISLAAASATLPNIGVGSVGVGVPGLGGVSVPIPIIGGGSSGSPTTTTPKPPTSGGKGDPIMTGLDGRSFEFFGKSGLTYNVLSEKTHQISMTLKEGKMWDHEGTYMAKVGLTYLDHTVEIANEGDELTVTLDGEPLVMRASQTEQEVILGLAQGEVSLLWQLHRPDFGNALEITTDLLQLVCWVTPAGTRDEGGKVQPAYINFDLTLHATPAHGSMEGIIGETYAVAASGVASSAENDFKFHGVEAEYEIPSLFETSHAKSVFGLVRGGKARKLIEAVSFPMRASTRGFNTILHASSQGLVKASRRALR